MTNPNDTRGPMQNDPNKKPGGGQPGGGSGKQQMGQQPGQKAQPKVGGDDKGMPHDSDKSKKNDHKQTDQGSRQH